MSHKDDAFVKVFIGVLIGLSVFTIAIIILANSVGMLELEGISGSPMSEEAVAKRIGPVGKVKVAGEEPVQMAAAPAPATAPRSGKEIVQSACAACHATGVAGAPKLGDKGAWSSRAEQGFATLMDHSINGYKGMPARGGNPSLSDDDLKKAINYMLDDAGVSAAQAGTKTAAAPAAAKPKAAAPDGMKVYTTACAACHTTGAAGAPRIGDSGAWQPRIAQGMDTLHQHALQGFRAMPPKGGRMDLSDAAVTAAVVYMVQESR